MNNSRMLIKKAFIESNLYYGAVENHNFSEDFEKRMSILVKSQKGIRRLVNTTAKKAAVIIIAATLILFTSACSVKAIREPVIEKLEQVIVNVRELLTGTKAEKVSKLFPTEVAEIVATSYVSDAQNKYVIKQEEKIKSFIELLTQTHWGEPYEYHGIDTSQVYWSFNFLNSDGESVLKLDMCNDSFDMNAYVAITQNGSENYYLISQRTYDEILAFTNRKFYLHDSSLEKPEEELCIKLRSKALDGLCEEDKKAVKEIIRETHYTMEKFLLNNVSLLKEFDSKYWKYAISGEEFIDPITGYNSKYNVFQSLIDDLYFAAGKVNDKETELMLKNAAKAWEKAMLNHDLEGLFKTHEYIHDYDYFVFNYPTKYVYDPFADFQGLDDYFGHLE